MARLTVTCEACQKPLGTGDCPACRSYSSDRSTLRGAAVPGSGPVQRERRRPGYQAPRRGGHRATDPPLTTRECADWMGVGTDYIVAAIDEQKLKAEVLPNTGRRVFRVYLDDFIDYLQAIDWKRLPKRTDE